MTAHGAPTPLTEEEERARAAAQHVEEAEQRRQRLTEEHERQQVTSSLLSRALHFSRAPPPSSDAASNVPSSSAGRVLSILFLSSTNSIVPHIAAAMTNVTHGDHIKARWSTSSPDSPLLDEHATEVMQEHEVPDTHPEQRMSGCPSVQ